MSSSSTVLEVFFQFRIMIDLGGLDLIGTLYSCQILRGETSGSKGKGICNFARYLQISHFLFCFYLKCLCCFLNSIDGHHWEILPYLDTSIATRVQVRVTKMGHLYNTYPPLLYLANPSHS